MKVCDAKVLDNPRLQITGCTDLTFSLLVTTMVQQIHKVELILVTIKKLSFNYLGHSAMYEIG